MVGGASGAGRKTWPIIGNVPCGRRATTIVERSREALEAGDTGMMAYRYLQSRAAQQQSHTAAMLWTVPTAMVVGSVCSLRHMLTSYANRHEFRETKRALRAELREKLGPEGLDELRTLGHPRQDGVKLIDLLARRQISKESVERKLQERAAQGE